MKVANISFLTPVTTQVDKKMSEVGAEEMTPWLRALSALAEDLDSVSTIHMEANSPV